MEIEFYRDETGTVPVKEFNQMDDFDKYLEEQLKDPDFKKEWDDHEMEYQVTMMLMKEREAQHMTQTELAERTGIRQSNISRIEKGQASPTLATLRRIARGLGKELQVRFV